MGGGNHFIEINEDSNKNKYLIIHSGSRNLGHQVATYYQNKAYEYHCGMDDEFEIQKNKLIENYKQAGKRKEIQKALLELRKKHQKDCTIPKYLCYLEGQLKDDYLHDMKIVQEYANLNRNVMSKRIIEECMNLDFESLNRFQTIHNYIDLDNMILRKGSISAQKDEKVLIPINMRDGSILAVGKGNPEWNYSAPHGAGRLKSRGKAKEDITLEEFENSMKNVFTTCVKESTIDESPMAYKNMDEILENTKDTIDIIDILKPIYNFKSS